MQYKQQNITAGFILLLLFKGKMCIILIKTTQIIKEDD